MFDRRDGSPKIAYNFSPFQKSPQQSDSQPSPHANEPDNVPSSSVWPNAEETAPLLAHWTEHGDISTAAKKGFTGNSATLPHFSRIQDSFGPQHKICNIKSYIGGPAAHETAIIGAEACAIGNEIAFSKNPSLHLAAHEAAHVIQQRAGVQLCTGIGEVNDEYEKHADAVADRVVRGESAADLLPKTNDHEISTFAIQRKIKPEDVASEMIGTLMRLQGPFSSGNKILHAGTIVIVGEWNNLSKTARVFLMELPPQKFDIPKRLLRPIAPSTTLAHYSAGVDQVVHEIDENDKLIQAELHLKGGPRLGEISRLENLQQNREILLNRSLIQEYMFNRFDPIIEKWTNHYNQQFGYMGDKALNPNLVKSMFYQESQEGTSGEHLDDPRDTSGVKSRFNIGQMIDSSAEALLIMMKETKPEFISRYNLTNITRDLAASQREYADLSHAPKRDAKAQSRFEELQILSKNNWENYLWNYHGFNSAVQAFFTAVPASRPAQNLDYDFWIQAAIRWLFEKRSHTKNWEEAIRAYNGGGDQATHYREAVIRRTNDATDAQLRQREYIPDGK